MSEPKCDRPETHKPHVQPPGFAATTEYCPGRSALTDGVQTRRVRQTDNSTASQAAAMGA